MVVIIIFIHVEDSEISYIFACFDVMDHESASSVITKNKSQFVIKDKELDLMMMSINVELLM